MKLFIAFAFAAIAFSGGSSGSKKPNRDKTPPPPTNHLKDPAPLSEEEQAILAEKDKVDEKKEKLLPLKEKVETAEEKFEEAKAEEEAASKEKAKARRSNGMFIGEDQGKLKHIYDDAAEWEKKAIKAVGTSKKNLEKAKDAYNKAWDEMDAAEKKRRSKGEEIAHNVQLRLGLGNSKVSKAKTDLDKSKKLLDQAKKILQNLEKNRKEFGAKAEEDAKKRLASDTANVEKYEADLEAAKTEVKEATKTQKAVDNLLLNHRTEYVDFVFQNKRY